MVAINSIELTNREMVDYTFFRGVNPLIDLRFKMPILLRLEYIRDLFGKFQPKHHTKYYKYCWDNKPHYCEETGLELMNYSAAFISHILSKGSHPEMAYDPRNCNILSFIQHNRWEFGDKENMSIYPGNELIIEMLKTEYNNR